MLGDRAQFYSLYLTKFASSLGYVTVLTLLPTYIDLLDPSGAVIGLFITSLMLARGAAVIPLAWAGDRYDKRSILAFMLLVNVAAYLLFTTVDTSVGFIAARTLQGLGMVGVNLLALALVGQLAPGPERANYIGKFNASRMAAGIAGTLGAGAVYELYGFGPVFGILAGMLVVAFVGVVLAVGPDDSTVEGFAFTDLAFNRRILTMTGFRAQYSVAVNLVRNWVPIFAGVSAARGGLAFSAFVVGAVIASEKAANMVCQPYTGRFSDRYGRAPFVAIGGVLYGLVALAVPFSPAVGAALSLPATYPLLGTIAPAFPVLAGLNALLGVADAFREPASMALFADEGEGEGIASSLGIRSLVWRPGSIVAPMVGGVLMTEVGMEWVFFLGGAAALSGVVTFLGILTRTHGPRGIAEW